MQIDYHTHTSLCKHATGDVEDYIKKAIELGFKEIGCSDHTPLPFNFDLRHRMTLEQYETEYAPSVSVMQEKYGKKIAIRRGLEADFFPGTEDWMRQFIAEHEFDYVIGSVHSLGTLETEKPLFGGASYDPEELEVLQLEFYDAVRRSVESGMFDIIGHCDIVKKFGAVNSSNIKDSQRTALETIKKHELCIELNTSGWRKPEQESYPGGQILSIVKELNIPITIGSDSHRPEDVGSHYHLLGDLIERYAGGKISIFKKREREEVKFG
ncbi:MAG: histidinol-phosphatase HisJ [bacterium]